VSTYISASILLDDESTFTPRTQIAYAPYAICVVDFETRGHRFALQTSDPDSFRRLAAALNEAADQATHYPAVTG
jgi:hypothetical protein